MGDFLACVIICFGVFLYLRRWYKKQPTPQQLAYYRRVKFNGERLKQELIINDTTLTKLSKENDLAKLRFLKDLKIPIEDVDEYAKDSLQFPGLLARRDALKWLDSRGLIQR